jgi:hypothetical protein
MAMDAITAGGESFGGDFVRCADGKVYLIIGATDARVLEVTGLDTIKRFAGTINYSQKEYLAAQHLAQAQAAQTVQPHEYRISKARAPITIDGTSAQWSELFDDTKPALDVRENQYTRYGRAQMRYDAENLYVAYRVFAPTDHFRNAGQEASLLFKTGDCVDLMLGPANGRPNGLTNERLLFSSLGGKPVAVLYEKTVPGTLAAKRVAFSSFYTIYFDRVTRPAAVQVATGPCPGGYIVEAKVPWSALGVRPTSGLQLRGDVGFLFADNGGTVTVARQYWSNKATGLVNDVPGEADLTPSLWGNFTLE